MNWDKNRVAPKVWLITGCSSGFGRALAEAVLKQGDYLLATARAPDQLQALIEPYPETAKAVRLDVTSSQDIQSAVDSAIATFDRIDVLVNNAGHGLIAALEEVSDADIHQFFATNFFGALRLMRSVLPVMRQQGNGHIVNMSSTALLILKHKFLHYVGDSYPSIRITVNQGKKFISISLSDFLTLGLGYLL